MAKKIKSNLEKLREAWNKMPYGGKSIVFEHGYTRQSVREILVYGRKDETILTDLLKIVKIASKKAAKNVEKDNQLIQSL